MEYSVGWDYLDTPSDLHVQFPKVWPWLLTPEFALEHSGLATALTNNFYLMRGAGDVGPAHF
jgi:hypothetical protein